MFCESHTTVLRKRPLDGDVPLGHRELLSHTVTFVLGQQLSKNEACARVFGPHVALFWALEALDCDRCDEVLMQYPDENDSNGWDYSDMAADPHVDGHASPRRDFDALWEVCGYANLTVPEEANSVFFMPLQNLNAITKRNSAVDAKAESFGHVCIREDAEALLKRMLHRCWPVGLSIRMRE